MEIPIKNKIYSGIGSRHTPEPVLHLMRKIALVFDYLGWTLYSGHAQGADQWFESGSTRKKIFLPWKRFENSDSVYVHDFDSPRGRIAERSVEAYHPAPYRLSSGARALIARNCYQISGWNHTPDELTDLVICWTKGAQLVGGTAQALRIALSCDIPIINLASEADYMAYSQWVEQFRSQVAGLDS